MAFFRCLTLLRKRRRTFFLGWTCVCLALVVGFRVYENGKAGLTEEILRAIGADRNTSSKVLPLFVDTTILNPSHGCQFSGKNALAVIFVPSLPGNRQHRERIRTTWGKYRLQENILLYFFIGNPTNITALQKEAHLHGDIIIDQMEENYYALPIKILRAFKWFLNHCHLAKFLIKVDEDVVLNLPQFARQLRIWPDDYHLGGHIIYDGVPHLWNPFSKWFVPRELWYWGSVAPPYLEGPCYIIRRDVVPLLLHTSYETPMYHLEDVFITGVIAKQRLKLKQMKFKGMVKQYWIYLWYLRHYFFDLCNFTSLHTDQNFSLFHKIFDRCQDSMEDSEHYN